MRLQWDRVARSAALLAGVCSLAWALAGRTVLAAPPPVDGVTMNRIADQGFNHGEVVELAEYLSDHIGARLTNSPAMRSAERWAVERLRAYGLKNVHLEAFDFGRGWWIEHAEVRLLAPRPLVLRSIPVAWTPGTTGALRAPALLAPLRSERDFADYHGRLRGQIVLVSTPEPPHDAVDPPFVRYHDADLLRFNHYPDAEFDPDQELHAARSRAFQAKLDAFLAAEGAVAWARMSPAEDRLVHGEGYGYQVGHTPALPGVEIAAEDYRRIARLLRSGEVTLEIDSRVHYEDGDHSASNVIGEIPGRDPRAGYVMAGAHLDSWVAGDGAADNGAGVAIVIEAARILAALGVQPRRTVRFALWAGEEQGLLGSAAYVEKHLAHRPPFADAEIARLGPDLAPQTFPVEPLAGYGDLAGYFNVDNGSGRIRGLYGEGNFAATALLRSWLAPFDSLSANVAVAGSTGATDHVLMSRIGLPAFEFIQDPLDYRSRVHHSDVDTFDHLRLEDLREAAVVVATILLDAADSDIALPRKPLPTAPRVTDPFRYRDPPSP